MFNKYKVNNYFGDTSTQEDEKFSSLHRPAKKFHITPRESCKRYLKQTLLNNSSDNSRLR